MMEVSQQEIQQIYKKAMINRSQQQKEIDQRRKEELDNNFWKYAHARIENLLHGVMNLYEMPNISKQEIDKAQKEFSDFLDMVNMNTIPEVIDELIHRESKSQYLQKLKDQDSKN